MPFPDPHGVTFPCPVQPGGHTPCRILSLGNGVTNLSRAPADHPFGLSATFWIGQLDTELVQPAIPTASGQKVTELATLPAAIAGPPDDSSPPVARRSSLVGQQNVKPQVPINHCDVTIRNAMHGE